MNDLPETLEQLASRLDALEKRVHDLEQSDVAARALAQPSAPLTVAPALDLPTGEQVSGAFLLLGKAMLGIAGAYLLRALEQWSALPRLLMATVAIAYAIGWLVAASRTSAAPRLGATLYAATASLILAPMLWELTMRFHVLAPVASAAVLGLFVAATTVLSWKREHAPDLMVALGAAALTALVLSVVTHESISFLVLLLAMVVLCEYKYLRTGAPGVRILIAAVADCAVWFLVVIYRVPASSRTDYPQLGTAVLVAPASLLLLITITSVAFNTVALCRRLTAFETAQSVVAFLLWNISLVFLTPHFDTRIAGGICFVFAGACYAAAYGVFRQRPELRNFYVFSTWSAGLFLAAVFLVLPPPWSADTLALSAITSAVIAVRICCITLECHGVIYLAVAALAGGVLQHSFQALAGTMPSRVTWSVLFVAASTLGCYVAARESEGEAWQRQILHFIPALLAVCAAAALAAQGILGLLALQFTPDVFHVAFIRSLILCAIALGLAFAGSRWRRPEMRRIAYAALAFLAVKLLFEDLRHGHMEFIAGSIFLFALALIGVPRLARGRHPVRAA